LIEALSLRADELQAWLVLFMLKRELEKNTCYFFEIKYNKYIQKGVKNMANTLSGLGLTPAINLGQGIAVNQDVLPKGLLDKNGKKINIFSGIATYAATMYVDKRKEVKQSYNGEELYGMDAQG
jgi:hypothetical protein